MERRVLLAIFLSFVVLYAYQSLLPPPPEEPEVAAVPAASAPPGSGARAPDPAASVSPQAVDPVLTDDDAGASARPQAVRAASAEQQFTIETDRVEATFTNRGAVLESWKLKGFLDSDGAIHDLVPQGLDPGIPRPLSLRFEDPALTARVREALFEVSRPRAGQIRFDYEDAAGLRVSKTLVLAPDSYVLESDIVATQDGRPLASQLHWGPALGPVHGGGGGRFSQASQGIAFVDGDVTRLGAADVQEIAGSFGFTGVDDQYFLAALIRPAIDRASFAPLQVLVEGVDEPATLVSFDVPLAGGGPYQAFMGPKDFDVLRSVDADLVRAIKFGWFAWLVVPLLTSLKWLHGYLGNYGWSIIALTVLINAVMFPLRHKSVVSMRKMQEIQPEIKAIQDRYAHLKTTDPDKQKMNTEVMALYRERGVNPASGCVPILLTMPVLFAFYRLLSVAIELRGAPFMGWIIDLSTPDPLYITPVVMGVTMFVQQRMTPSGADPMQQKMMMMMPAVFMVSSFWFPSGLVLYWLVSNLWNIGQQAITNRLIGPPVVRTVRPPAERQVKKAGKGKSRAAERNAEKK